MKKISELLELLDTITNENNLHCISDNDYIHKGVNIKEFIHFGTVERNRDFDSFKNDRDLNIITKDLKIFISYLYLYLPFINDPLKEYTEFNDKKLHTYIQNEYDSHFMSYVSVCYEKLYNFWDRIGDRLWFYYNLDIKTKNVGFPIVMQTLNSMEIFEQNPHFIRLKSFWENDFKHLNAKRKRVVHYYQEESQYFEDIIQNPFDTKRIEKLHLEKKNLPYYFKKQLENCLDGMVDLVLLEKSTQK